MTIHEISKIFLRTIDAMNDEQKREIRDRIDQDAREKIRIADGFFLSNCGIQPLD